MQFRTEIPSVAAVSPVQRRAFERFPADIKIRFYCCDTDYFGTVTDMSENGMFIRLKKMIFPFDSRLEIIINNESKLLRVPVRVIRITKTNNVFDGIGVEVLKTCDDYLRLVYSLRYPS